MTPERLYICLPAAPSVNTIYTVRPDGVITYTRWARKWKTAARAICRVQAYEQGWKPLEEYCRVVFVPWFPDGRVRDVTNLHKIVCDALTTVVYTDDRYALAHDRRPELDTARPRLELVAYRDEEDLTDPDDGFIKVLSDFRETFAYARLYGTGAWSTAPQAKASRGGRRMKPTKRRKTR